MFKRFMEKFRRDRSVHQATVKVDFFPQDQVTPRITWLQGQDHDNDTVVLVVYFYARILYELAEINEVRVARELMEFVSQVQERVLAASPSPGRPRLPLGKLKLSSAPPPPALRTYQGEFFQLPDGSYRLEYQGSLGKEGFYLPAAFLALLQSCLDHLIDEALQRLIRALGRMHDYYSLRRDFWEAPCLRTAPVFALGEEELSGEALGAED